MWPAGCRWERPADDTPFAGCVGVVSHVQTATPKRAMQVKPLFLSAALGLAAIAPAVLVAVAPIGAPAAAETPAVAVGPQYDTAHVYVAPEDVDRFAQSFLATFGGQSTKQVVATVTPTPSSTTVQLLQTRVGTVSLFGFRTPIPYPFG